LQLELFKQQQIVYQIIVALPRYPEQHAATRCVAEFDKIFNNANTVAGGVPQWGVNALKQVAIGGLKA